MMKSIFSCKEDLMDRMWYLIPLHMVTIPCLFMLACPSMRKGARRMMRKARRRMGC